MLLSLVLIIIGAILLAFMSDYLVQGSSALAAHFGVSSLVIGLTVVAFGTSAPELATSLQAPANVAVGNALGSNLMNMGIILAITAIIFPLTSRSRSLQKDLIVMVLAGPFILWFAWDREINSLEGAILFLALVAYLLSALTRKEKGPEIVELEEEDPHEDMPLGRASLLTVAGLVGLVIGGKVLVVGAIDFAEFLGLSERIIALTVVAGGTSLPELAACIQAGRRGKHDIALGNVVGSNIFNLFGVLGLCGFFTSITNLEDDTMFDALCVLLLQIVTAALIWTGCRINRVEGTIILFAYFGYLAYLFL